MPMMGRGSDTRMYAPRSESETMYSSANEDGTKYSGNTPEEKEKKEENRKLRAEERKQRRDKIKHIKIRSTQGLKGEESPVPEDDSNKQDDEREISLQGGPAGSRGNLLDLATGAKTGTGSAMTGPLPIAMSEPMKGAWSSLLKGKEVSDFIQQYPNIKFQEQELWDDDIANETDDYGTSTLNSTSFFNDPQFSTARSRRMNPNTMAILQRFVDKSKAKPKIIQQVHGNVENPYFVPPDMKNPPLETASTNPRLENQYYYDTAAEKQGDYGDEYYTDEQLKEFNRRFNIQTGVPMDNAWSTLLKAVIKKNVPPLLYDKKYARERTPYKVNRLAAQGQGMVGSKRRAGEPAKTRARTEAIAQRRLRAGIPEALMYANPNYYPYVLAASQLPPNQQQMLPFSGPLRRDIEALGGGPIQGGAQRGSIADKAGFSASPVQLHNLQRLVTTMIPQKFMMDEDSIDPLEGLTPVPGQPGVFTNAQGGFVMDAKNDPRHPDYQKSSDFVLVSDILKRETPKSIESRRRREKRQQFRPSTGQFKRPPGGMNPVGATMRRFRARMRGIKGGRKTGLMKPHLSVEMSHRGIATKQPMSKDPQKYRQYMGQSEARKILGNVRSTFSPHARYGERSVTAGPTGAGRLGGLMPGQSGQMRQPSLKQIGVRRPRLRRPRNPVMAPAPPMGVPSPPIQAPSSISPLPQASTPMMMSEERAESDLLKGNRNLRYHKINLLRRLIAAQERAEKLGKSMQGTRSAMENGHVPSHPAAVRAKDEEDPEGPTENLETDAKRFGLDPAGYLTSKRGHMG